jgi:hypothetical protein
MTSGRRFSAALLLGLVALACSGGGGNVATYALCTAADTCPSSTTCEPTSATSTSAGVGPTFCTWSCGGGSGKPSCPNDANGIEGVCVTSLDVTMVGGSADAGLGREDTEFGLCFRDCSSVGTCPSGEACKPALPLGGGDQVMVCMPADTGTNDSGSEADAGDGSGDGRNCGGDATSSGEEGWGCCAASGAFCDPGHTDCCSGVCHDSMSGDWFCD